MHGQLALTFRGVGVDAPYDPLLRIMYCLYGNGYQYRSNGS